MNETELLAAMQVFLVLLCGVLVFSVICTVVEAVKEYHRTRVVRHTAKHSRGPEVPVSHMVVPKSTAEGESGDATGGATEGAEYTPSAPQGTVLQEDTPSAPQVTVLQKDTPSAPQVTVLQEDTPSTLQEENLLTEEPKQTWSQPSGYSRALRKRHARHGR